ncbi:ABC-2 type transport system ATP-binding protein [Ruminococcus sp. YE71]|uniref:ABC transporter ATP-binding protein n=1 Tax=unclassified Ruminococcus TaxID=2608920 RepID=UPI0008827F74|nr:MULTISPECIES: ABC transporter ATP-binding protein [unclassified Ruminococcus]SDA21911.1 ABC-2 type transport system ATP-binding protein [Ruminococcus sp. YE78]SFW37130.1 ABC-2 type transport system ATP-binding protein [Ruminococcus sp. YE71]
MNEVLISVNDLSKQYKKSRVLKNVSFSVGKGMICGLVGPNGAGKTTIMKAVGGLILPTEGSIELFGETTESGLAHSRSRMSFIIETPYAKQNMTAAENLEKLRLQKGIPDKARIGEVLEIAGLRDTGRKPVKNFSLGMKQRLGIAAALMSKPEVMVLDEPINGLDPEGIVEIRELLLKLNREEHITIVISSHILSELSLLCTDYLFIRHGELVKRLSAEELKKQCSEQYCIRTDNDSLVPAILRNKLGFESFEVEKDGRVRLYEGLDDTAKISRTLFENGVTPTELFMKEADLEQYYMELVGDDDVQPDKSTAVSDAS